LKESGQLENTLVVYSADQGFSMGEHGFRTKLAPYDANYRSPLVVSMPGRIPQGKYCPHPVSSPDLVVTFFQFAGLELPWRMHGRDISPLLKDPEKAEWPHPLFYEHTGRSYGSDVSKAVVAEGPNEQDRVPWYVAVRQRNLKYIRYLKAGEIEELYDLAKDPEELVNLAAKPEQKPDLERLRAVLKEELRRTEAGFADKLRD
jgi:arylsulfatase A-like enzyme